MTVEESQDVYNYQQSAERKRASSYDSQAFNLGGGVNWKYKINDAMSKREGKIHKTFTDVCKEMYADVLFKGGEELMYVLVDEH